jgi:hypothetical protein
MRGFAGSIPSLAHCDRAPAEAPLVGPYSTGYRRVPMNSVDSALEPAVRELLRALAGQLGNRPAAAEQVLRFLPDGDRRWTVEQQPRLDLSTGAAWETVASVSTKDETPCRSNQSPREAAMNSRPLSERITAGLPCSAKSRSSTAATSPAPIERATLQPTQTRVCSSTTLRIRSGRPSRVTADMKSYDQTSLGCAAGRLQAAFAAVP